ncbi:phosphoglucomutase (alpha-D-glucose-1,6-bisphosphate-dependent) [Rhodoluna lacicola]|uniref:phosphoglucomutase (alpha-D-glucose-1,6-bisphosphate-dependent) n=1 Tax=Rhodoluna lacicola TaxID=529884 RepID=UPI00223203AF|nr:phosphoglucomutase (alpha-D-glucose-1,6-bisphosphate-dependent) [Rhodoluna lacicola]BDS49807.1 phosphoglucomutase, alpha-D-glucose phosphate-specific [Rhodoluna lacicola]
MSERAGKKAQQSDLVNIEKLIAAYFEIHPDVKTAEQKVAFGTSGHRGTSLNGSFNEDHIAAITQAIVEYRRTQNIHGPIYVGKDTHALSGPAEQTALEVLAGNDVITMVDAEGRYVPTPSVSVAIINHNEGKPAGDSHLADGLVITPSHNPPTDGGFKYNPPHGGPADSDATNWIAARANEIILGGLREVKRAAPKPTKFHFRENYISQLGEVLNVDAIRDSNVSIGADPMGGASVDYWGAIGEEYNLNLTVVNPAVDFQFGFMPLDWDEKIRMDCSSPFAMASLIEDRNKFDISTGNDADADRHGIVTRDHGLMNPNHFLAVCIDFLYRNRPQWRADAAVGKTMVSSSIINRVVKKIGRKLIEVPVGFKWFVPGLIDGSVGFGGEESAGASFLRLDGSAWSTDKDGLILALLAAEITAVTGKTPSQRYAELTAEFGAPAYERIDAPATLEQKAKLGKLSADAVTASELAGEKITAILTHAPGNGAALGGLKVETENAWFAARPSGTENVYKIYGESFNGAEHLKQVQAEAKQLVDGVI